MNDDCMAVAKIAQEAVAAPPQSKGEIVQRTVNVEEGASENGTVNRAEPVPEHLPAAQPQSVPTACESSGLLTPSRAEPMSAHLPSSQPQPATRECENLGLPSPSVEAPEDTVNEDSSLDVRNESNCIARSIEDLGGIIIAPSYPSHAEEENPITLDITGSNEVKKCEKESEETSTDVLKALPNSGGASSALLSCLGGSSSGIVGDVAHDRSDTRKTDSESSSVLLMTSTLSTSPLALPDSSKTAASSRSASPARSDYQSQKGTPVTGKYARRGSHCSNTSDCSDVSSWARAKLQRKATSFRTDDLMIGQSRGRHRPREGSFTVHASDIARTKTDKMPELGEIQETVDAERQRLAKHISSRAYDNDRKEAAGEKKLMSALPADDNISITSDIDRLRQKYLGFILPFKWALTGLSAVAIALQAGIIILGSHELVVWKLALVEVLSDSGAGGTILAYLFFLSVAFGLSFMAAMLVTYAAPHAGGGGIPEVIAHLNGVEMPQAFTFRTWLCRSVGLIAVTSAGIFAGPEGPFVHIGSLVAVGMLRGPKLRGNLIWTPCLQGHRNRCEYISQGAAMGVAAAFGAPIGGVLFSLEEASTYWNSSLTWRTFFGCSVAAVIAKLTKSGFKELSMTGFIEFPDVDAGFEPWELCMFFILAVVTGLSGGVFCLVVGKIGKWRRICYSLGSPTKASRRARVAEVMGIVFLTISLCFWVPVIAGCRPLQDDVDAYRRMASQSGPPDFSGGICAKNEYSDIGYILLQPKEEAVKALFSRSLGGGAQFDIPSLLVCFVIAYGLTLITFGSAIPCGLFIPNILAGACLGRAMGELLLNWDVQIHPGVYSLMGSAGMLAGFSRMTIALTMIMLEITNNMKMLIPLLVTIMVSKLIADKIAVGVNHQVLHLNPNVHLLEDALSEDHLIVIESLTAHDLCLSEVVVLHEHEPIGQIMCLLMSTSFEGYPVIGSHNKLLGFVPRINLANAVASYNPQCGTLMNILKLASAVPEITPWNMPLARAYHHFRSSGLQRLCVVDEKNELIGLLTRTDFARLCKHGKEGVEEIRMLINRKHAKIAAGLMVPDTSKMKPADTDSNCTPLSARSNDQESVVSPRRLPERLHSEGSTTQSHRSRNVCMAAPSFNVPSPNEQTSSKISPTDAPYEPSEASTRDQISTGRAQTIQKEA